MGNIPLVEKEIGDREKTQKESPTELGRHQEHFFLFDVSNQGRIVTGRAPHHLMRHQGERFCSHLSPRLWERILSFLKGYQRDSLLVRTDLGVALIRSDLMPSASVGVAMFPHGEEKGLLSLMNGRDAVLWSEIRKAPHSSGRKGQVQSRAILLVERLLTETDQCLLEPKEGELEQRLRSLSSWIGCPTELPEEEGALLQEVWDAPTVLAFFIGALCLCRRHSSNRSMAMLSPMGTEPAVALRMAFGKDLPDTYEEILWMESLADRQNMLFERASTLTELYIKIVPIRRDWAYLGIKKPKISFGQKVDEEDEFDSSIDF